MHPAAYLVLVAAAGGALAVGRRRTTLAIAGRKLGLRGLGRSVSGRLDDHSVTLLSTSDADRFEVEVGELGLAESFAIRSAASLPANERIPTGDPAFDAAFALADDGPDGFALMSVDVRRGMLGKFHDATRFCVHARRAYATLHVRSVEALLEEVERLLAFVRYLESRALLPLPQRLADQVLTDPEPEVRFAALRMLAEHFPSSESLHDCATGLDDHPDDDLRLRAALLVGDRRRVQHEVTRARADEALMAEGRTWLEANPRLGRI